MNSQQALTQREQIAEAIIKFAQENNLEIHPGQDPFKWADLVIKKGGCPCVPDRNHCPCEFVLEDIKESNRCRCGLFVNDTYIDEYNRLLAKGKARKGEERVNPKAKSAFLKKIAINGFSIIEGDNTLTLRPRGMEETAEITIQEVEPAVWAVVGASGQYAGFYRGKKRSYFEDYINRWAAEAVLETRE